MTRKHRIAVVGAGISGLASAWLLSRNHEVTLFEAADYLGGHTNTVDVTLEGKTHPVDTGFLVFNDQTYPNLIALFELLGVDSVETEMSFAVSLEKPDLEWAGSNLATVFGQKRNLLRRSFWAMLADILRFNRESQAWLVSFQDDQRSLRDFLTEGRYSPAFSDWYLLPMAAAIWSCPTGQMLDMPLSTFIRFCRNHGLLQVFDRPTWRTVQGGGRAYVRKVAEQLDDVRLACPVSAVSREAGQLRVVHAGGSELFDRVVMACHSDQALAILGMAASDMQREILSAIRYQPNRAVLHTDRALLPRDEKLWSAWNYFSGSGAPGEQPVGVSYLINKLQPLPFKTPVVVTLNPAREPDSAKIIAEFDYAHPIFDGPAIAAQRRLAHVQGENGIWLAGAWGSYGFHEDGLKSALRVANSMGIAAPWQMAPQAVERELDTV
ncbi:FAD-dependent oxidoreductase [Dechloromonas sp. TW-R-39-2]|uniref:NAD(P)/FAD-dependent oxidoreductase n=1 Tax=Dechloromonas sp. TW-R-39-2 TaxID=2654218 RepID=UPI00193D584F|nr:FAD-dependent oxidoreductase [Dechloromonas sp. TW-R-39-2]QRM18696.1 FAD-dependent oxidoreductase [Dechloromonas sp. TW-R-39-2]